MTDELLIDGGHGEGGGQIVRAAMSLAAITGRAIRIDNIRPRRARPGLSAQHVTAVRAVAAICGGRLEGDELGSVSIAFEPTGPPHAGEYIFDVATAREGGSAGSAVLVLQTVLLPLAHANGESRLVLCGGTHLTSSPTFDYANDVWLPALVRMGIEASAELAAWGWFPVGQGEIRVRVAGGVPREGLKPFGAIERGALRRVRGRAVAANLPSHIPQRTADRARSRLMDARIDSAIEPLRVTARSPGAGIFLCLEHESACAGFTALGVRGKPSEVVAQEAVDELLAYVRSDAALDQHLADQLVLPAAIASGTSQWTAERAGDHFRTMAWLVRRFGLADVEIAPDTGGPATVTVVPSAA